MIRFMACGDTHGDGGWMSKLILEHAVKEDVDILVQLGDFGYSGTRMSDLNFLDRTSKKLVDTNKKMYWIDGNHDNQHAIWDHYQPGPDGFCEMRENLYYIPRGTRFTWGGVRFLALGGAYSIDKPIRLKFEKEEHAFGRYWWPTEKITDAERDFAIQGGEVDVMLTHDCPWGVEIPGIGEFWESNEHRKQLTQVVKAVNPDFLIHGHYHQRISERLTWASEPDPHSTTNLVWNETRVEGFSCNGKGRDAWGIFSLTPREEVGKLNTED